LVSFLFVVFNDRFGVASEADLELLRALRQPKNTVKNTHWAMNVYTAWAKARNKDLSDVVPIDISGISVVDLNKWLCLFVVEARRCDGEPYPSSTLYGLVTGIMRYLREDCHRVDCDILLKSDKNFVVFRNTLDAQMKSLTRAGIGTIKKSALPFSEIIKCFSLKCDF
jgi:hypothetical protein